MNKTTTNPTEKQIANREARKATLARLMAAENITVRHSAQTRSASFNTDTRVLTLPAWKTESDNVWDLLVAHEVGHALHTPPMKVSYGTDTNSVDFNNTWIKKIKAIDPNHFDRVFGYCNIVEDARIETAIKNRFPGTRKNFIEGYKELVAMGIMGTKAVNFIDRFNIFFKLGSQAAIEFTAMEQVYIDRVAGLKSFSDTLQLVKEIYAFCKEQAAEEKKNKQAQEEASEEGETDKGKSNKKSPKPKKEKKEKTEKEEKTASSKEDNSEENTDTEEENGAGAGNESDTEEENGAGAGNESDTEEENGAGENSEGDHGESSEGEADNGFDDFGDTDDDGTEAETLEQNQGASGNKGANQEDGAPSEDENDMDFEDGSLDSTTNFDKNLQSLIDESAPDYVYHTMPASKDILIDNIIVDWKTIYQAMGTSLTSFFQNRTGAEAQAVGLVKDFYAKNDNVINYLVKEFNLRKAATDYANESESRTGQLDCNKLHTYRIDDNIFRRVVEVAEGKSHGLVMFIDWSGSMQDVLFNTVEQLIVLGEFARKVNIPFEVYSFSDANYNSTKNLQKDPEKGEFIINHNLQLRNYLSSTMNRQAWQGAVKCLISLAVGLTRGEFKNTPLANFCPMGENLHYTPLNDTIVVASAVVEKFRKATRVEKVNVIFLTDGDATQFNTNPVVNKKNSYNDSKQLEFITDRETGKVYEVKHSRNGQTLRNAYYNRTVLTITLLKILGERSQVNVIGFLLVDGKLFMRRMPTSYQTQVDENEHQENTKTIKEQGSITKLDMGYDELYVISSTSLKVNNDGMDDKLIGASKAKLTTEFNKTHQKKLNSRIMLKSFIGMIA